MNVEQKLNRLFGLQSEYYGSHLEEKKQIQDLKVKIMAIESKISEDLTPLQVEMKRLEDEISQETIELQSSQRGDYLQAIYTKPPTTFDSKRFRLEQPQLFEKFTKTGNPRVKITAIADETRKAV